MRFAIAPIALVWLVIAGIDLRLAYYAPALGSDVDNVTRAAIDRMVSGLSPYGYNYPQSVPPGATYPYGPLALLWYLPFPEPRRLELLVSFATLFVLAARGRPLGLAIYALLVPLLVMASDGSNDNSAGLLLLIGLVLAERWPRAGAVGVGLAIAFKPYALAWVPALIGWQGIGIVAPLILGAGPFWFAAIAAWGPSAIWASIVGAEEAQQRVGAYYSLGQALKRWLTPVPLETLNSLRLVWGGIASVVALLRTRTHAQMVLGGTVIFLLTLFLGGWSTYAYFGAIAPVLCWYVDDWLGHADERVVWVAEFERLAARF